MNEYLSSIANSFGVSIGLLIVIFIWEAVWKLIALWRSARKGHVTWFIILAIVNTIGILSILYIFLFSELDFKKKNKKRRK